LLLVLASTGNLVPPGPMTKFLLIPELYYVESGFLFDERRGLITIGHSHSAGSDSSGHSLIGRPFPPKTHTLSLLLLISCM
jgi:hypothetical protein